MRYNGQYFDTESGMTYVRIGYCDSGIRRRKMSKKKFYPLIVHILLCVIYYLIFRLIWMGPEGGSVLVYFSDTNVKIVFIAFILSIVVQAVALLIYFYIGKNTCSRLRHPFFTIGSICILNVINVVIIYFFNKDIGAAMKTFAIFGGAPFFILNLLSNLNIFANIITVIAPSVIMLAGYLFEKYYAKIRRTSESK